MKKRGFTLIELLVVISIIALLVSILMPALGKAREQAKATACMSNVKQMSTGFLLYSQDFDGKMMGMEYGDNYWFRQIAPYLGDKGFKSSRGQDAVKGIEGGVMQIGICQATKIDVNRVSGTGTNKITWHFDTDWNNPQTRVYGSYGVNAWVLKDIAGWGGTSDVPKENFYNSQSYDTIPGQVPLISDSIWVDSWPDQSGNVPTEDLLGSGWGGATPFPHGKIYFMGRFCVDRHSMAVNVGFVDTHVERTRLRDLWLLKWHRHFVPNPNPMDTSGLLD